MAAKDSKNHEERSNNKDTKEKKANSQKTKNNTNRNLIIAAIILIAIVVIYTKYNPAAHQEEVIVASINAENITLTELSKAYDSMPQQLKVEGSKKILLDQMIEARLVYQEAKKQGFAVITEEAERYIESIRVSRGLTEEQFSQILAQQNITKDELITQYIKQLTVQKYLNETLLSKVKISDEEIKTYYNENKDSFKITEKVTVKHILIGDQNLTLEEKNETANTLLKEITKDNFCDYVENHSTDTASIPACGEYTFSETDQFVPEFKEFSFNNVVGKIGIAQTQYGFHIIYIVKRTPAKTLSLTEAKPQIKQLLEAKKAQEEYKIFYEKLLQKSVINIYYNE